MVMTAKSSYKEVVILNRLMRTFAVIKIIFRTVVCNDELFARKIALGRTNNSVSKNGELSFFSLVLFRNAGEYRRTGP